MLRVRRMGKDNINQNKEGFYKKKKNGEVNLKLHTKEL